jgi:type VI protein secretion system component Hcp
MRQHSRRSLVAAGILWLSILPSSPARAGSIYLDVPGITGEDSIPGHSGVMAVGSLTVNPHEFLVVKHVDAASPQISLAVALGSHFSGASLYLFNLSPPNVPDVKLSFQNIFASSYQNLGGISPLERDGFSFAPAITMYLELPGITGESSTPGHPGVIPIESLTIANNAFSVVKLVDATSPDLFSDAALATTFADARILFYGSAPTGPPDLTLEFRNIVDSGYSLQQGANVPLETDRFNFESFASLPQNAIPESSSLTFFGLGATSLAIGALWSRRRPKIAP